MMNQIGVPGLSASVSKSARGTKKVSVSIRPKRGCGLSPTDRWLIVYTILISPLVAICALRQPYIIKNAVDNHIQ